MSTKNDAKREANKNENKNENKNRNEGGGSFDFSHAVFLACC